MLQKCIKNASKINIKKEANFLFLPPPPLSLFCPPSLSLLSKTKYLAKCVSVMSNSSCSREFTRQLNLALSVYLTILSESSGASSVVKHDRRKSWHFRSRAPSRATYTRSAAISRNHADYPAVSHFLAPTQPLVKIEDHAVSPTSLLLPFSLSPSSLVFLFLPLSLPTATFAFVLVSASTVFYGRCELACIVSLIGQESESVGAE